MFMLYRLSYMWYTVLGTLISMIVSYLVSISWKRVDLRKIDVSLLTPCLRKYYKTTPVKKLLPQNEKEVIIHKSFIIIVFYININIFFRRSNWI